MKQDHTRIPMTACWISVGLTIMNVLTVLSGLARPATFCNPLDLDYRFRLEDASRREAADPAIGYFEHEYWLFASKCGGYWHSPDFRNWTFVDGRNLPIEDYAPAPAVINGQMYYTAFGTKAIYRAEDLKAGVWAKAGDLKGYAAPALFQDDDGSRREDPQLRLGFFF